MPRRRGVNRYLAVVGLRLARALTGGEELHETASVKIELLQDMLEASPFVPFSLVLPNGEKLRIPHPDFAWIHPSQRCVSVALANDGVRMVNWQMVTGIETKEATA